MPRHRPPDPAHALRQMAEDKSDALAPAGQPGDSYIGLFRYNVPALVAAMAKN